MRFELEHVVAAPVARVFALVSDITRRPEWVGIARERSAIGGGPLGEGSRFHAVDRVPGRTLEYTQTIERLEQNQILEESWDGPMAGHSIIRFREEDGATALFIEAEVASPLPGFLTFVGRAWARRVFRKDLARLDSRVVVDGS